MKLSLFFYSCFLVVWLILVAIAYMLVDNTGFFDTFEEVEDIFFDSDVELTFTFIEKWALYIGLALAIVGSIINALIAVLYNIASDIVGGLELTFVERDV